MSGHNVGQRRVVANLEPESGVRWQVASRGTQCLVQSAVVFNDVVCSVGRCVVVIRVRSDRIYLPLQKGQLVGDGSRSSRRTVDQVDAVVQRCSQLRGGYLPSQHAQRVRSV